ncbi:MAG: 50S ribosomal protein L25/general stress protein Ctc [Bacteroidales bacterium]
MKTLDLKGTIRTETGKKATKRVRREEKIPCILYGINQPIHFEADAKEYGHLIYTPHVYLANLDLDGAVYQAIVKEIQFHPVSDKILHIDFIEVQANKPISVKIPVQLEGFAKGVQQGGKLVLQMRKLALKGLVSEIPAQLDIDVTNLEVGQTLKVRELSFEGIELLDPKNSVVATIKTTRAAKAAAETSQPAKKG